MESINNGEICSSLLTSSKPRRKYRSNFLTNLFRVLENEEYPDLIRWSDDGTQVELLKPFELASTAFPKMYRHSKLTSFTKQLGMYHFERVSPAQKLTLAYFHPLFRKGRSDLIPKIDREQVIPKKKVSTPERQLDKTHSDEKYQHYPNKKVKTLSFKKNEEEVVLPEISFSQFDDEVPLIFPDVSSIEQDRFEPVSNSINNKDNQPKIGRELFQGPDFQLLFQIASTSKGNIKGSHLPAGYHEFKSILEKMLGFKQIDEADITVPDLYTNDWKPHNWNLRP